MNSEIEQAAREICAKYLTGEEAHDRELLQVCAAGIDHGQRQPTKQWQIVSTTKLVAAVARATKMSYRDTLIALQVPKVIRQPVLKTLAASDKLKQH